jgi:hypothetical protein
MQRLIIPVLALLLSSTGIHAAPAETLENLAANFSHPPAEARPWVYWFWNNGNVTRQGITADLEAMRRAGIGGVIIMDVLERFAPPKGTATFMGSEWMALFHHSVTEAQRLGLEINMTNGPGWCGSSGPWITPGLSMQHLVSSSTELQGPSRFEGLVARPDSQPQLRKDHLDSKLKTEDYYRDVAVLAFPEAVDGVVPRDGVMDLTSKMKPDGGLVWEVPPGKWNLHRIGHASTGSSTRPPVLGGNGLECDKLSREAMDVHFAGMMRKLIDISGPLAGKALGATHIDSWEVGSQNWTPRFRDEFQRRRGYDPVPFLPCVTGSVREEVKGKPAAVRQRWNIGGKALADRFRWDFQQTLSELLAENYSGRLADLAHEHGLRLSMEGYDLKDFGDEATYTAAADEPMSEFWTGGSWGRKMTEIKGRQMASVAHVHGRTIVGAEAFTSGDGEKWLLHPALIKAMGDYQFARGINRFVIHRYAHQPWLDRVPGSTMGPWGLHYERTNTWWEMSTAWHEYLSRCQYLLRHGLYVADLLYLRPEVPHQAYFTPLPAVPAGYAYDECSAQALMERASVRDGRIVLPDGMSYRMLVLPPQKTMTPALLRKLRDLAAAGAVIAGLPPRSSPSLGGYPECDKEVADMAKELWADCDGTNITRHDFGKGRVVSGQDLTPLLTDLGSPPDFSSNVPLEWIHRRVDGAEVYFVSNQQSVDVTASCVFRAPGLQPEYWNPESGARSPLPIAAADSNSTTVSLRLERAGSAFIVFRKPAGAPEKIASPFFDPKPAGELGGPWEVRFPPMRGAPETITLPELISWSDHPDAGVKYFSGTATYSKTFTAGETLLKAGRRVFLNLGDVQIMARVRLNGRDLGILWKPPYRMDITGNLKSGANELQIEVVNLMPNRMIGDAALPEGKRFTWSTWQPFKSDTPLLKSGLIGPVGFETCDRAN